MKTAWRFLLLLLWGHMHASAAEMFEERLREQKEAHHGGSRWIGTGGTSPFGHGGRHPSGLRVGGPGGSPHPPSFVRSRTREDIRRQRMCGACHP